MGHDASIASEPSAPTLSIGDLADRTGVSATVLRGWESRHGFPTAVRLPSGHRRYAESDVLLVDQVQARRAAGVRLDVAIAEVTTAAEPQAESVWAAMRRADPGLTPMPLRRTTLLNFTWAIEDECAAVASHPRLFGGFQTAENFTKALPRWTDLAAGARVAMGIADFDAADFDAADFDAADFDAADFDAADAGALTDRGPLVRVPIPSGSRLRREWIIVVDAPDLSVALVAWDRPGQDDDLDRVFETVWSFDPGVVRAAARACAGVALAAGVAEATAVVAELASPPIEQNGVRVADLLRRVLSYSDRGPHAVT